MYYLLYELYAIIRDMSKDEIIEELQNTCATQTEEIDTLTDELKNQSKVVEQLLAENQWLKEQHNLALNRLFKKSSEHPNAAQEAMVFDEAETVAVPQQEPTVEEVITPHRKKEKGQREQKFKNLDEKIDERPASEEQTICPTCGEQMEFVRWQERKELCAKMLQFFLKLIREPIHACRNCQKEGQDAPIHLIKTQPSPPFPKSFASASLVSQIIHQKFVMGSPLYRQEQNMKNFGVNISRQTMANWMIAAADWMQPLYKRMHEILLTQDIIHADETKVQVLHEEGRDATTDSTMWLYRSGREGPPILLFEYQTSRAGKHAKEFLKGFGQYDPKTNTIIRTKYLITDGHEAYNLVPQIALIDDKKVPDIIQGGCLSHVRRKFFDAAGIVSKKERKSGVKVIADYGVDFCDDIFDIERETKEMTQEERLAVREEKTTPILIKFKIWLDKQALAVLPKSATRTAITYALNQWSKLTTFMLDGRIAVDNNSAERAIRPFTVGRKNWLFANTPNGAKSSAILYSIVETAKENGLNPFEYANFLLENLPNIDSTDNDVLDSLMPWNTNVRMRKLD